MQGSFWSRLPLRRHSPIASLQWVNQNLAIEILTPRISNKRSTRPTSDVHIDNDSVIQCPHSVGVDMRGKSQFCDVLTTHHAPPSQKRGTSHRFGACVGAVVGITQ